MSSAAGDHYGWVFHPCWNKARFICQAKQMTHLTKQEIIYRPGLVMPFDNFTYESPNKNEDDIFSEQLIAFPHKPVHQTELDKPASFLGTAGSFFELENNVGGQLHFKYGVTISVWINVASLDGENKAVIVDFSQFEDDHSLRIYLKRIDGKIHIIAESCNSDCSGVIIHK